MILFSGLAPLLVTDVGKKQAATYFLELIYAFKNGRLQVLQAIKKDIKSCSFETYRKCRSRLDLITRLKA